MVTDYFLGSPIGRLLYLEEKKALFVSKEDGHPLKMMDNIPKYIEDLFMDRDDLRFLWVPYKDLAHIEDKESNLKKISCNKDREDVKEMDTLEKDKKIARQNKLIKLTLESLINNVDIGLDHNFKNLYNRDCTRTSLHNQIVLLRYQLKELDRLIDNYPLY